MPIFKKTFKVILGHKIIIKALSLLIFIYLFFVYSTSKKTIIYCDKLIKTPCKVRPDICVFWHNRLAMIALFVKTRPMNVLISSHGDGLIISSVMKFFRIKTIAGSTNRNALSALRNIQAKIKLGENITITPDGPRGPVYQINSNVVRIAAKNHVRIAPVTYSATRSRIFKSWDKFIMPLPFNRLVFIHGNSIQVKHPLDTIGINKYNTFLKQELDRITFLADQLVHKKL